MQEPCRLTATEGDPIELEVTAACACGNATDGDAAQNVWGSGDVAPAVEFEASRAVSDPLAARAFSAGEPEDAGNLAGLGLELGCNPALEATQKVIELAEGDN